MPYTPGQEKCINTLDRSLVVAAGAGSGKTFTLTKRIVHAIQSGEVEGIDRVCAITFTNKAAGELKSRIKAELRACGLAQQALAVDEAWVSTIHGMCARILRAHALELDLDPAFKMADAPLIGLLQEQAVDQVLAYARLTIDAQDADSALCERMPDLVHDPVHSVAYEAGVELPSASAIDALFEEYPARSYGPQSTSVESMIGYLVGLAASRPDGFSSFAIDSELPNPAGLVEAVLESFEAVAGAAAEQKPNESREAWAAQTLENVACIRQDMQDGHASDFKWALEVLDGLEWPKKVGSAGYKQQVADALEVYRVCVMELRLAMASGYLRTLVALARFASALFASAKRRAGVLDNNDLLVLAYNAVTGNPDIAAEYADKFQLIMVDEFQDTDQMQVDMIKALAGPGACRLCTVGDAQQSIYRFRGADVSVYNRHLRGVEAENPEDVIRLDDNFRSHADVLSFVDRVFEQPSVFGGGFMSLSAGRDERRVKRPFAAGYPRIQIQLTSTGYRGASSERVRQMAAERIADSLAELHEAGHSAGDMALLLGGMTYAGLYADALRSRGLACVISGGSVFAQTPEAALVHDFVQVIANPYQTQALHNVLTGALFELTASDLLALTTTLDAGDGRLRRVNLATGLIGAAYRLREGEADKGWSGQLVLALRIMGEAIDAAGQLPASRIIQRALAESGLLARLQERGAEGLASAANLLKALRMVETVESASAVGPAGVARDFAALLDNSKEAPGALSASGGDFVHIMTVHASKGLEFPIVAVAEFKDSAGSSAKLLSGEAAGQVFLSLDLQNTVASLPGWANLKDLPALYAALTEGRAGADELLWAIVQADGALARRAALFEYDRDGDEEEAKRLLYVALTRAKEALVVSLRGKSSKENPFATPKGCFGSIVTALAGPTGGFDAGRSVFEYGGSMSAAVEHVVLSADESGSGHEEGGAGAASADAGKGVDVAAVAEERAESGADFKAAAPVSSASHDFMIPLPQERLHIDRMPHASAHEGIFSYSSIAGAAHKGDVLERLAGRFFVSADACDEETAFLISLRPSEDAADNVGIGLIAIGAGNQAVAGGYEDDGSWAYGGVSIADSDKATDFGTAFHRLAQYAVNTRGQHSAQLLKPEQSRIEVLGRAGRLDGSQRLRLEEALDRWFASDVAAFVAQHVELRAEVPFFLRLSSDLVPDGAFLEGEIDLLALDETATSAIVVDYKTGGRADETEQELARKHVLQASCYAYAVMSQGVKEVEAVFVRVERRSAADPEQPQCVRYRFVSADLPALSQAIAEAYVYAAVQDERK